LYAPGASKVCDALHWKAIWWRMDLGQLTRNLRLLAFRAVFLEFPSEETAVQWYNSPEYKVCSSTHGVEACYNK
jgi:hypothetical protein